MDRCRTDLPLLDPLNGSGREAACWLQRAGATTPPELAQPDRAGAEVVR
jgi:hypothetical protein